MKCDPRYGWSKSTVSNIDIYLKGDFYYENTHYEKIEAFDKIYELFSLYNENSLSVKKLVKIFNNITGHYSFILNSQNTTLAVVDRIRSYPIYYTEKDAFVISNSPLIIQNESSLYEIDDLSMLEFEMSGFVIGRETLYKSIYQLLPGEIVIYNKDIQKLRSYRYYQYELGADKKNLKSENDLLKELHNVHLKVFSELINSLNGRPVWLPLSGGLDSRFILSMLLELKYDNITTFSYGPNNFWEIKRAKQIAEFLNVKWYHIPYEPHQTRKYFYEEDTKNYYKYAWGMNTVPVLSDYYAILMMRERGLIPYDAIFINGQSGDFLTGGHIPEIHNKEEDINFLLNNIIGKHHSLWKHLKTNKNLDIISNKLLSLINKNHNDIISDDDCANYYEYYEWQERQCKYVINGVRVYEWFNYDWRLPLWNDELMYFWERVPWEVKIKQNLFKRYLEVKDPSSVFSRDWYSPDYQHVPLPLRILTTLARRIFPNYDIQTKCVNYYSSYAAFYPQIRYWDYLKESSGHKNSISFHANLILKSINKEK
jgi:asparagine synthase (glutamine-hydrolysing)